MKAYVGSKYVSGRPLKEITKAIRQDIKEAKKQGAFPEDIKVSVRITSGRRSKVISIILTASPYQPYSPESRQLTAYLEDLAEAHRYSTRSHPMSDHTITNFFCGVGYAPELFQS